MSSTPGDSDGADARSGLTRGQLFRGAAAGSGALMALSACGGASSAIGSAASSAIVRRGGTLRVGVEIGAGDVIDAHAPTADADIVRVASLYEPLAQPSADFNSIDMVLAESIAPVSGRADLWDIRLRPGIEFHNGKTLSADDVIFSLRRIIDPRRRTVGAASIGYVNAAAVKKLDPLTVRVPLTIPNSGFLADIGQYFNGIVPVGYDPRSPVGTGAFQFQSLVPGRRSVYTSFPNYWQTSLPKVDRLIVTEFSGDGARLKALLAGRIHLADALPVAELAEIRGHPSYRLINNPSGSWQPFTMRVDRAPFNDVRVRRAFRLMADRSGMLEQVLGGSGSVANDLYGRYDPAYDRSLPQTAQDLEQAKFLLDRAGRSGLAVELITAPIFPGATQSAQAFAREAKGAGVTVNVRQVDPRAFYGPRYLRWTFAQGSWGPRRYLSQVAQGSLPSSPFNETHWADSQFIELVSRARAELDNTARTQLIQEAQRIEHERGGYVVPYFSNYIGAYSSAVGGIPPGVQATFLLAPAFKHVGFTP